MTALHVRPPWESPSDRRGMLHEIVIDPGQAFGTGAHATTRTVPGAAARAESAGADAGRVWGALWSDRGCSTWAAARGCSRSPRRSSATSRSSGARPRPRERDRDRAERGRQRRADRRQRFDLRTLIRCGDIAESARRDRPVVLANLLRPLLLDLAERMRDPPAHLITSGLLTERGRRGRAARSRRRLGMSGARAPREPGDVGRRAGCGPSRAEHRHQRLAVGQLGRGADDRAVDEVDRRAHALRALQQHGAALSAEPIVSNASPTSPGSGSRQAASAISSIASACSGTPANRAGPVRLA